MSTSTALFLLLRVAHVLIAVVWVGGVFFSTFFLMPALAESGPAAGPVMGALARRKIHVFMASIGGMTVLTGLYLYYRFTGGFDPALSGTRGAMAFGTGGVAGTIALIIGGAVVGRNTKKLSDLGERLATASEKERAALVAQMTAARVRAETGSRIVIALQVIAVVLMAIGHYV
jgi:uncharacterized membrane protein